MSIDWTSCVKCNLGVLPPWYGCGSGHIICINCSHLVDKNCPKCGYMFNNNGYHRLTVLENIAKNTPGTMCKCVNKECKEKVHLDALQLHVDMCNFTKINCMICTDILSREKVRDHYINKHNPKMYKFTLQEVKNIKPNFRIPRPEHTESMRYLVVCTDIDDIFRVIMVHKFEKVWNLYIYCERYILNEDMKDNKFVLQLDEYSSNGDCILMTTFPCKEKLLFSHTMKNESSIFFLCIRLTNYFKKRTVNVANIEIINADVIDANEKMTKI